MRIILYTGKGGVGKTSVAAATAIRAAELGYRTIVLSTDAAHSLADSFDVAISPEPKRIASGLWAQEVDVYHELESHWGTVQAYAASVLSWRGVEEMVAEEMTAFPGMEELASLLEIVSHHDSGKYDLVIVDCAPTGETLRLLAVPDVARWWLEKIFPLERKAAQILRPVIQPLTGIPMPDDKVFDSIKELLLQLDRMHKLLSDPEISSVRLVLNPEKMVIKEAQRTFTYLNLYDYPVDAVISNRLIPRTVQDAYFDSWKESQDRYGHVVEDCFAPLPILKVPLFDREVVGRHMLKLMGEALFGDEDPTRFFFKGKTHSIEKTGDGYVLSLPLPLVTRKEIDLARAGDELIIRVGHQRRNLLLPRAMVGLEVLGARFQGETLQIRFAGQR